MNTGDVDYRAFGDSFWFFLPALIILTAVWILVIYSHRFLPIRRRSASIISAAFSVLMIVPWGFLGDALNTAAMYRHEFGRFTLYIVLWLIVAVALLLAYLGFARSWPTIEKNKALGFPLTKKSAKWMVLGGAAGLTLAVMDCLRNYHAIEAGFHIKLFIPTLGVLALFLFPSNLIEECIFRGRLMELLADLGLRPGVVLVTQALVFAAIHIPARVQDGLSGGGLLANMIFVLMGGLLFGWMRNRTGNLWMSTAAHVCYNSVLFAVYSSSGPP